MGYAPIAPHLIFWKPVRQTNPARGTPMYRAQVVTRHELDLEGLVKFTLADHCTRGKLADMTALWRGLWQGIAAALKEGRAVSLDGYMSASLVITGSIDPETRRVSESRNGVKVLLKPLQKLKPSSKDYTYNREPGEAPSPTITGVHSLDQYFNNLGILSRYEPWVELVGNNLIASTYDCVTVTVEGETFPMRRTRSNDPKSCKCFCFGGAIPWAGVPKGTRILFTFTGYAGRLSRLDDPETATFLAEVAGSPS